MENIFIETARVQAFREAASVVADTQKGQPGFMLAWGAGGQGQDHVLLRICGAIRCHICKGVRRLDTSGHACQNLL